MGAVLYIVMCLENQAKYTLNRNYNKCCEITSKKIGEFGTVLKYIHLPYLSGMLKHYLYSYFCES